MGHRKVIGIIVILLCILSSTILAQQNIVSPCPNVFKYQFGGNQWFGVINIPSPPLGTTLRLNLNLSIKAKLPSKYIGQIELLGKQIDLIKAMVNGWNLNYKVHFPLINPIPKVTSILFNGASICSGPPEMFTGSRQYVTSIDLHHVLHTTGPGTSSINQPLKISQPISPEIIFINTQIQDQTSYRPIQNKFNQPETVTNNYFYSNPSESSFKTQKPASLSIPQYSNNPFLNSVLTTTRRPRDMYTPIVPDFSPQDFGEGRQNPSNLLKPPKTTTVRAPIYTTTAMPTSPPSDLRNIQYNSCGKSQTSPLSLIIGGESTRRDEWPWLVAMFRIEKNGKLNFICAGSLISDRHIVTAAHCIPKENKTGLILRLGVNNIQEWNDENAKTAIVEDRIPHPDFNSTHSDIAVLIIKPIEFTKYISPVCLWEGDENLDSIVGRSGMVVGWGRDGSGLRTTPKPRQTQVPIVSTVMCRGSKQEFFPLTSNKTICAGKKDGTGPCNGDSGGGMYLNNGGKWMLRGIVSNSLNNPGSINQCNLIEYVIYTDAAKYSSWIQQIMYQYNGSTSDSTLRNVRGTGRLLKEPDFPSQDFDEDRPNPTTNSSRASIYTASPLLYNSCGKSQSSISLTIGGDTTDRDEFPWLVAMFKKGETGLTFICAGSLLSNRLVVTAARCISQKNKPSLKTSEIVLKLGAHDIQDWTDDNAKTANVAEIIPHPAFIASDRNPKSDIAVLVINAVQFTQYISPICLWQGDENLNSIVGRKGTVVGWGRDGRGLVATSKPRQTQVPIVSTDVCNGSKQEFFSLTSDTTICAGKQNGTDPCIGTPGGGMYLYKDGRWMLRGIVSNSLNDPGSKNECNIFKYFIYTDAAKFSSWIEQIMYLLI